VVTPLPKLLTAIALAASIGLHLALFQSMAWVGMVITYSQQAPIREALSKTFDGRHPCLLCKQIAKERRDQRKSDRQSESKRLEFVNIGPGLTLVPPYRYQALGAANTWAQRLSRTPPLPPPKDA
jgi:hypothetical protein